MKKIKLSSNSKDDKWNYVSDNDGAILATKYVEFLESETNKFLNTSTSLKIKCIYFF